MRERADEPERATGGRQVAVDPLPAGSPPGRPLGYPPLCILAGPTGAGKTAAGVELALRWATEIISADSMQVYRRLSLGTAKPTAAETRGVPYHLIDFLEPIGPDGKEQRFNAAEFIRLASPIIERLGEAGKIPLVVGGTGLYLEALTQGLFDHPPIPPEIRDSVEREVTALTPQQTHERLEAIDPESAARIHPHDRIRIARAIEVRLATGKSISQWRREQRAQGTPPRDHAFFVLNAPRRRLYERINQRVDRMFEQGLVAETKALLEGGLSPRLHCMKALGYAFIAGYLEGKAGLEETVAAVKQSHRNYAKRQLTWFRKAKGVRWISVEGRSVSEVADLVENSWRSLKNSWDMENRP